MNYRTAYAAAELVAVQRRGLGLRGITGIGRSKTPIIGVEHGVTHILEERAVPVIGARLGEHVNDAVGKAAILGAIAVGLDAEFLHRIGTRKNVAGIAQSGHVVAAVEVVVHRAGAAIDTAVNQGALFGIAQGNTAGVVFLHAGGQRQERINVAVDQWQSRNFLVLHGAADLGVGDVDERQGVATFNLLPALPHL